MARIHNLKIKNFRGIKQFDHTFGNSNFICLIGRGDSGKSTILEAISLVLSPNWNIGMYDSDFFNCDLQNPIEIETTLVDLPDEFFREEKFGFLLGGLDTGTGDLHSDIKDDDEKVLTIKLTITKDLEPIWTVVNGEGESKPISSNDRGKLNVYMIADRVDRHFSWSKGNPLYSLLKQENSDERELDEENIVIASMREAKSAIDKHHFEELEQVTEKVIKAALSLGVIVSKVSTTVDFKDLFLKDGRISLHSENIPFRLKGNGAKRLISIAIQKALSDPSGIILIDEIEQGLEPDRVQHLVGSLKKEIKGQIFITTHSRDVLVELEYDNLFLMRQSANKLTTFPKSLQGCLRKNPEAFFANKVVVCEGLTEIGLYRALSNFKYTSGMGSAFLQGIRPADGTGANMIDYVKGFSHVNFDVSLFCDSDDPAINKKKKGLEDAGIKIMDWENDENTEVAIITRLPVEEIPELIELAQKLNPNINVKDSIKTTLEIQDSALPDSFNESQIVKLGTLASEKGWFKTISKGEELGKFIFSKYSSMNPKLKEKFNVLSMWIDGHGLS